MWNYLDLKSPSDDMVEYLPQDKFLIEKLADFATVLLEAGNTLASDDPLWKEMCVLKNIQAKYRRILRCDRCLIYLHRISQCVKKMVLLNLSLSYRELAERLLIGLHDSSSSLHLPSQQQVEYIMIRTQSAAKLVTDAVRYSRDTFCFLIQKLKIGHHILDLHMATSVTARINVMLKGILVQLYDIYLKVFKWRSEFKKGKFKWPKKLNLPENLEDWIATCESNLAKPFTRLDTKHKTPGFEAQNGSTENDADSVIVIDTINDTDSLIMEETEDTDFGEVIPRKDATLTSLQKKLLRKILLSRSIKKLEILWNGINKLSQDCLPVRLSVKKSLRIAKYLKRTKTKMAKFAHILKQNPQKCTKISLPVVTEMLAKYLGFTHDQIHSCKNMLKEKERNFTESGVLKPVKTLWKLKLQYKYLCQKLLSENNTKELKKLTKKFKRKIDDIKLLKNSSQKASAKDLTLCTSKVLLTLYQKSLQL